MDLDWNLEPWILDTVISERRKHLAANSSHAISSSTTKVDCTGNKLVQILNFGGQRKPPFTRLSISDSSTRIFAKLSESARKEIQDRTGRRPPSQTEGAVCELAHYSLIFDPTITDGVIVDIHRLLYKGGACMSPIGEPKRINEQEGAAQLVGAMGSLHSEKIQPPGDEPMSSQVLSQEGLILDDGEASSQEEDIATQVPRNRDAHDKSHHIGDNVMMKGNLLSVLESFHECKVTPKRPSSSGDAPPSQQRPSKRQHIEQTQRRKPSLPSSPGDERNDPSSGDQTEPTEKSAQPTAMIDDMTGGLGSPVEPKSGHEARKSPDMARSKPGDDLHNKAVSDNFHIGLKSLSKKLVSPPRSQLQYLSFTTRYIDPRLPAKELPMGVPSHIVLELSAIHSVARTSLNSTMEATTIQPTQGEEVDKEDAEAGTKSALRVSQPKMRSSPSPIRPERYAEGDDETDVEFSDASSAVSWPSSAHGSPNRDEIVSSMKEASPKLGPVQSHDKYLGSPVEDEEEPQSSPFHLPTPMPAGLLNVKPARSIAHKPLPTNQVPSSSPSIDYELEQEVPVALHSSGELLQTQSKSPTPGPKDLSLTALRSPVLQIERSPCGPETNRRVEKSLFCHTVTKDGVEKTRVDTRALSSDPVIPATCVDSQETINFRNASLNETMRSVSSTCDSVAHDHRHRFLVPATIPARSVSDSHKFQVVNSSNSETHVVPGTIGVVGLTTSPVRLGADKVSSRQPILRHGEMERAEGHPLSLQSKSNIAEPSSTRPRPHKVQLVAPAFSQLKSSVDTVEVARASRRSFLAQPKEPERELVREAILATSTAFIPKDGDRQVAGDSLEATTVNPHIRSITSAFEIADINTQSVGNDNKQYLSLPKADQIMAGYRTHAPNSVPSPGATIFDKFKLEYRQFRHERSKFVMACTYIKWLQDNRKIMPVHPFLWDDFIRTFCGPYSDYVRNQKDETVPTESPVDFYNNEVTSPIFDSNIVTQKTLPLALANDPHLTTKHSRRLRRISSNFVPHSRTTTPQEPRIVDMVKSPRSSLKKPAVFHSEIQTRDGPDNHLTQPNSPILGEPVREKSVKEEAASTTNELRSQLHDWSQKVQATERKKPEVAGLSSGMYITPKTSVGQGFINLTQGNGTPAQIPSSLDPVEKEFVSNWVPGQRRKSKKVRSRYSLPRPGSAE